MTEIFVPGIGQHDNIGDIILRRQLLDWLRPVGRLHIYVGNSPSGYDEALSSSPDDIVYRSFAQWYRVAMATASRGDAAYVSKPGEIQLTVRGMKEHVSMLPLLALIRRRGGAVVRVGAGSRNFAALPRMLMRPAISLSELVVWRDRDTADYLGGEVMPDLAFGEGAAAGPALERDTLAVSLRYDRQMPPIEWLDGVQQFAGDSGLRIAVLTQVLRDRERSRSLSHALGAELVDWDGRNHGKQEEVLRSVYQRSALVLSDRLHVLIAAITEGAVPLALIPKYSDKIERHFAAAGIDDVAVDVAGFSTPQIVAALDTAAAAGRPSLAGARTELDAVRRRVQELITSAEHPDIELVEAHG